MDGLSEEPAARGRAPGKFPPKKTSRGVSNDNTPSKDALKREKEISTSEQVNVQASSQVRLATTASGLRSLSVKSLTTLLDKLTKRIEPSAVMALTAVDNVEEEQNLNNQEGMGCERGLKVLEETQSLHRKVKALLSVVKALTAKDGLEATDGFLEDAIAACEPAGLVISSSACLQLMKKHVMLAMDQDDYSKAVKLLNIDTPTEEQTDLGYGIWRIPSGHEDKLARQEQFIMNTLIDILREGNMEEQADFDRAQRFVEKILELLSPIEALKKDLTSLNILLQPNKVDMEKLNEARAAVNAESHRFYKPLKLFPMGVAIKDKANKFYEQRVSDASFVTELSQAMAMNPEVAPDALAKTIVAAWSQLSRMYNKIMANASDLFKEENKDKLGGLQQKLSDALDKAIATKSSFLLQSLSEPVGKLTSALASGSVKVSVLAEIITSLEGAALNKTFEKANQLNLQGLASEEQVKMYDELMASRKLLIKGFLNYAKEIAGPAGPSGSGNTKIAPSLWMQPAALALHQLLKLVPHHIPEEGLLMDSAWQKVLHICCGMGLPQFKASGGFLVAFVAQWRTSVEKSFEVYLGARSTKSGNNLYKHIASEILSKKEKVCAAKWQELMPSSDDANHMAEEMTVWKLWRAETGDDRIGILTIKIGTRVVKALHVFVCLRAMVDISENALNCTPAIFAQVAESDDDGIVSLAKETMKEWTHNVEP